MNEQTFSIKQGDTAPNIKELLVLGGVPIDLTGANILFRLVSNSGTVKVNAAGVAVAPATGGIAQYLWQVGDTDTPGSYKREWQVTLADGSVLTVPNNTEGYPVEITNDLV